MKKNIVALAVAAAISAPAAMADAPTVYGQLNVTADFASGSDMDVQSVASRLGVKGSEDLGNGLKAVYKVEFGLAGVTDGGTALTNRNQYAGLAGGFGTVLLGRHDTPEKMSQAKDLFNDGAADLNNNNLTGDVDPNEEREGNVIAYMSPSFSGVKLMAAHIAPGDATGTSPKNTATSAAITYGSKKKGLYLAAAMTDFTNNTGDADTTRISAQYKTGGLTANVIWMDAKDSTQGAGADNGTVTQMNLGYKMGKFMPKLKISTVDEKLAGAQDHTNIAYGLNYSLGKKTTAYIEIVDADKKNEDGTDQTTIGLLHKF